jgi:lipoprotein-anchoring transpeptidase ErfK/SrfK
LSWTRLIVRLASVIAFACVGLVVLAGSPAGGGRAAVLTTAPSSTLSDPSTSPSARAAQPLSIPLPPKTPRFMIGMVTRPIVTAAGDVSTTTPLGARTWLLILHHHGNLGVALVPSWGRPQRVRVPLSALELHWTRVRVDVDLSRLRLVVLRGRQVMGRFAIAAGTSSTPTPTGLFSVTDRVAFSDPGTYGSFALGLSAHQTHLVPGWHGGDQIAIHGTEDAGSIGSYASLGCIRVSEGALRLMRRAVPLGAPVLVHA